MENQQEREQQGPEPERSKWGRVRFGGGRPPAMAAAIPIGIVLALGLGLLFSQFQTPPLPPLIMVGIFAFLTLPACVLLPWAVVVDRTTLRGALKRPEDSVESRWYDTAAQGAFHDTITVTGLALAMLAVTDTRIDAVFALSGVIAIAALSTSIRYLVARARG